MDPGLLAVCNRQFIPHVEEGDSEGDCCRFEPRRNEIGLTRPVHRRKIAHPYSRRLVSNHQARAGLIGPPGGGGSMVLNPVVAFCSKSGLEKRDLVRLLAAFDALDSVYFFFSLSFFRSYHCNPGPPPSFTLSPGPPHHTLPRPAPKSLAQQTSQKTDRHGLK